MQNIVKQGFLKIGLAALCSLIVLLLATKSIFAQQASDACGCNAALMNGIFSYRAERGDSEARAETARYIARMSYEEFQKAVSSGGGFSFAGFGLDANTSQSQFERRRNELREEYKDYKFSKSTRELLERYGDKNVLDAWSRCKESCNSGGLRSWVRLDDANNMALYLKWVPFGDMPQPVVTNSSIAGAVVRDDNVPKGKLLNSGETISTKQTIIPLYREDKNTPVTLNIKVTGAGTDVYEYVPPFITPKPIPRPLPPMNVTIEVILCSGVNCDLPAVKNDHRPKVRWEATLVATNGLGPQLALPEGASRKAFCKSSSELTASELGEAFQGISWRVVDNPQEAQFFDLDDPPNNYFKPAPAGRFYFANNAHPNHHLQVHITLTLRRINCQTK
jgi:hypothetical protein